MQHIIRTLSNCSSKLALLGGILVLTQSSAHADLLGDFNNALQRGVRDAVRGNNTRPGMPPRDAIRDVQAMRDRQLQNGGEEDATSPRAAVREPNSQGSRRPQSTGFNGPPIEQDLGTYSGPPRWTASDQLADNLSNYIYSGGGNAATVIETELGKYILSNNSIKSKTLHDFKNSVKITSEFLNCTYSENRGAKIEFYYWTTGSRKTLTPAMYGEKGLSNGFSDVELDTCPQTLSQAIELGFGRETFDRIRKIYSKEFNIKPYCETEIQHEESRTSLSEKERKTLYWYKRFNADKRTRGQIIPEIVQAHQEVRPGETHVFYPDKSPVSACLLHALADESQLAQVAPFAMEGYALKLLSGDGIARNKALGIEYLERAARDWNYGAAAMRLGLLYLDDKSDPANLRKAINWLENASSNVSKTFGRSPTNPTGAPPLLFDIYLSGKYGARDPAAAERLYRSLMENRYFEDLLAKTLPRIPGLKDKLQREKEAREDEENRWALAEIECARYKNGSVRKVNGTLVCYHQGR